MLKYIITIIKLDNMDAKQKLNEVGKIMNEVGNDDSKFQSSFVTFMGSAMSDGSLDTKTKELIALSLGITARCEWCISFHVNAAFKAGATRGELMEVGYVTVLMYGSPALMEMNNLLDAINQFEPK